MATIKQEWVTQGDYTLDILLYTTDDCVEIIQGEADYVRIYSKNLLPFIRALLPENYEIREKEVQGE